MMVESLVLALMIQSPFSAPGADTLTYHEVSEGQMEVAAPQGRVALETFHNAHIAFVRVAPDSAHAWYEALEVGISGPQGEMRPATQAALRQEFVLRLDGRARVETLKAPEFPKSFEGVTDLTKQFYDFFMPGPGQQFALGVNWTDTLVISDTTATGEVTNLRKRGRYRVVRDSVVRGEPVWVVSAEVHHESRSEGPGPQPGITAISILNGSDTGEFIVHKEGGYMVGRRRTGRLSGEIRYEGLPQPLVLPQTMTYTNSVELLPLRVPKAP